MQTFLTRFQMRRPQTSFFYTLSSVVLATIVGCSTQAGNEGKSAGMPNANGTTMVTNADGSMTTTTDGMVTTTGNPTDNGTGATTPGTGQTSGSGNTTGAPEQTGTQPTATSQDVWVNQHARVEGANNPFGIQGDWYAFGDGVTSQQMGNPYKDGKYCVTGQSTGDSSNWGVGIGLDLNNVGDKQPYEYEGKLSGFRIKVSGEFASTARVNFVTNLDVDVSPFIDLELGDQIYNVADAVVPLSWGVDNAGMRVEDGILYSIHVLAPGDQAEGPIDFCIEEFEPIYDPNGGATAEGGAFINPDNFAFTENNDYGVQGPFYIISDGTSAETGAPYVDGKYCVSGEFTGAGGDQWGAGIAFDVNNPPGGERQALDTSTLAGFRIGLSGNTPGMIRIQYVTTDSQEGNQPFVVGQLNTTSMYPLEWAQVPASWDVSDAGKEVGDSLYTVQVFLEGDQAGPFEVCIEEFSPLTAAELTWGDGASPADAGFNGFKTVDEAALQHEYDVWKNRHFQDCGDGSACIPRDDGDCISEGIGYGMLLTVAFDDQDAFDKLWSYYQKHKNGNGVMDWQTSACGNVIGSGSATDGELDSAMALIQASCKWGGTYEADATTLLSSVINSEVAYCNNKTVLKPGDGFGGCDETNPSYVAPAYYRVFEQLTGDSTWGSLVDDGYALLEAAQANKAGLLPDWCDSDGTPQNGERGDYGPDASRVPWRMANDYIWNGEARAAAILDNLASYIEGNGGVAKTFTPNSNFRGGAAFTGMHQSAPIADEYTNAWLQTSVDDGSYFPGTLRPIYMLLAANQFSKGCN